jgi:hypothetical protein
MLVLLLNIILTLFNKRYSLIIDKDLTPGGYISGPELVKLYFKTPYLAIQFRNE